MGVLPSLASAPHVRCPGLAWHVAEMQCMLSLAPHFALGWQAA